MAISLITITGTDGKLLLKYKESTVPKSAILEKGNIYLDDATVTDVTYTTLYGDLVASSGVFTITELPSVCYHFKWDFSPITDYEFVEIEVDGIVTALTPSTFPNQSPDTVAETINSLGDDNLKAVQAKVDTSVRPNFTLVIKALSVDPPRLKVSNTAASASFYIEGEVGSCTNVGFYDYNTCQPVFLP